MDETIKIQAGHNPMLYWIRVSLKAKNEWKHEVLHFLKSNMSGDYMAAITAATNGFISKRGYSHIYTKEQISSIF